MKKILFTVTAFLLAVVTVYLIGELTVYGLFRKEIALFPRYVTAARYGDYQIRGNIPNRRYEHKSYDGKWKFRINAQGFRGDQNVDYQKPEGIIRVLLLGDSFTIGFEAHENETYASVLESRLRQKGYPVEVINAGVSGFSNAEELIFFEQEGVKYQPDFLVLGFFENDLSDNVRADLYRLRAGRLEPHKKVYLPAIKQRDFLHSLPLYSWLSENSYLHNYLTQAATFYIRERVKSKNISAMSQELGLEASEKALKAYDGGLASALIAQIHAHAQAHKIPFILMDIPHWDTLESSFPLEYNPEKVSDVFLDMQKIFEANHKAEPFYWPHGQHHWTALSHRLAGEALAEVIQKKIEGKKP